ncbi:DNA-binding LacI/PurR family transcriptional regulator [Agromyces hippuratus]|uniref:DNA-binding LacI/PurR family transcriptional regulator n=1 Tax=Agromyces hippuratus TaxID=286438 RepID=A0A852WXY2_9MICO|nr:LacI family DNA-binding transcriptional regulator [Agromyces hippuratus]NYG22428.1 DNA-binding LacI/PurR family transcriptional regulator [Agromyces hippuratus]
MVNRRTVTIRDVAERAGVATSTVSRALSRPGRVSESTRELVERVAAELDYRPSVHASALGSRRTGAIALVVADIANGYYVDVIRGTQLELGAAGYRLFLVDTEESADAERAAIAALRGATDGIVIAASRLRDAELRSTAALHPLVTINRSAEGVATVVVDTAAAAVRALEHVASLGHRRVAFVGGPAESWSGARRRHTTLEAGRRLGVDIVDVGHFTPTRASGVAAADAVLLTGATACLAYNDAIAIGMLGRLHERGVAVPGDLSVVGCDDVFGADFCSPPLTTIRVPGERAGRAAAATMLAQLRDPDAEAGAPRVLSAELVVRRSTGSVAEAARTA